VATARPCNPLVDKACTPRPPKRHPRSADTTFKKSNVFYESLVKRPTITASEGGGVKKRHPDQIQVRVRAVADQPDFCGRSAIDREKTTGHPGRAAASGNLKNTCGTSASPMRRQGGKTQIYIYIYMYSISPPGRHGEAVQRRDFLWMLACCSAVPWRRKAAGGQVLYK
jgi:hypothetical protein